jgi:hypothetical protein
MEEIKGLAAGGFLNKNNTKNENVGKIASRGIVLANLPGSLENFKYIIEDEFKNPVF